MNRFEQRMRHRLQNSEIAAGFHEMAAERALMQTLEEIREQQQISKEELAARMGKHREAVSRLLNASDANPTLETVIELLIALGITAEITLRPAIEGEEPIKVARAG